MFSTSKRFIGRARLKDSTLEKHARNSSQENHARNSFLPAFSGLLFVAPGFSRGDQALQFQHSSALQRGLRVVAISLVALGLLLLTTKAHAAITDADVKNLSQLAQASPKPLDQPASVGSIVMRFTFALGVVFGLIVVVAWAAKKYLPARVTGGRGGPIDILATRALGAGKNIMLVRIKDKTVLLGVTSQNIQFLTDIDQSGAAWDEAAVQAGLDSISIVEKGRA